MEIWTLCSKMINMINIHYTFTIKSIPFAHFMPLVSNVFEGYRKRWATWKWLIEFSLSHNFHRRTGIGSVTILCGDSERYMQVVWLVEGIWYQNISMRKRKCFLLCCHLYHILRTVYLVYVTNLFYWCFYL